MCEDYVNPSMYTPYISWLGEDLCHVVNGSNSSVIIVVLKLVARGLLLQSKKKVYLFWVFITNINTRTRTLQSMYSFLYSALCNQMSLFTFLIIIHHGQD